MPVAARIVDPDVAAAVHDVGDDQDLGVLGVEVLVENVDLEVTEPAAEGDVPDRVEVLVPEQQDGMLVPGPLDGAEGRVVRITRKIHAAHLGAERRVEGTDFQGHRRGLLSGGIRPVVRRRFTRDALPSG